MTLIGIYTNKAQIKKGGNPNQLLEQLCVREFEAEVVILHHATTIQENYQAVLHCGGIRQAVRSLTIDKLESAKIVAVNPLDQMEPAPSKKVLRTGDKGLVRFRFMYSPELLKVGATIMFREGRTKGLGYVTKVYATK